MQLKRLQIVKHKQVSNSQMQTWLWFTAENWYLILPLLCFNFLSREKNSNIFDFAISAAPRSIRMSLKQNLIFAVCMFHSVCTFLHDSSPFGSRFPPPIRPWVIVKKLGNGALQPTCTTRYYTLSSLLRCTYLVLVWLWVWAHKSTWQTKMNTNCSKRQTTTSLNRWSLGRCLFRILILYCLHAI